jgi:TPR repeat protein
MGTCRSCGGSGKEACGNCGGRGYQNSWDSEANGYTDQTCSRCGGTGKIPCYTCGGSGDDGSSSSSSGSSSSGGSSSRSGGGNNRARAANEVIAKYNSAYEFYGAQKHKEAGDAFGHVVNTLRDPKWKSYTEEINSHTDAFRKDFEELDKEFPQLCFLAGLCYGNCADDKKKEGKLSEALTFRFWQIGYVSYSGEYQDLIDAEMQVLAQEYAEFGNCCKNDGAVKESKDYFQRAVNIAGSDTSEYLKKQGIDLSDFEATVDTINDDAFARYNAQNWGVAVWLWKKTADMGDAGGQYNLGLSYYLGVGVPVDYSKAFELHSKAAVQGRADAMNYLGVYYWHGYGVNRNVKAAEIALKKAIKMGSKEAKQNLKELRECLPKINGFLSFLFGVVGGIGATLTVGWIIINIAGMESLPKFPALIMIVVGFFIAYNGLRNRKNILFLVMLALTIPGWLIMFRIIPEHINIRQSIKSVATQTLAITQQADITSNVNFRKGPSTNDEIIRQLKQGDTVTLTGEISGGWTQITHNGETGWVSSEYLKVWGGGQAAAPQAATQQAAEPKTSAPKAEALTAFPSEFTGTWKRDNYSNTLTFTEKTLNSSSQSYSWNFVSESNNAYTIQSDYSGTAKINIKLVNNNIEISGDSGGGEDNWNGTWVKQ